MLVRFATSGFDLLSKDEQKDAQKRKLIEKRTRKQLKIMRGPAYVEVLKPTVPFLTKEMLASSVRGALRSGQEEERAWGADEGEERSFRCCVPKCCYRVRCRGKWEEVNFKPLKLDAVATHPAAGHLHPLMKYKSMVRRIFISLGSAHAVTYSASLPSCFTATPLLIPCELTGFSRTPRAALCCSFQEMPTSRFVESSLWNFDALFQPQAHPCRDMQDTFFMKGLYPAPAPPSRAARRPKLCNGEGSHFSLAFASHPAGLSSSHSTQQTLR